MLLEPDARAEQVMATWRRRGDGHVRPTSNVGSRIVGGGGSRKHAEHAASVWSSALMICSDHTHTGFSAEMM